jgi:hypothetical protein
LPKIEKNSILVLGKSYRNPQTEVKQRHQEKQTTNQKFGFIESLSYSVPESMKDAKSIEYINKFSNKKIKDELLHKIFELFNEAVFKKKVIVKNYQNPCRNIVA